MTAEPSILYPLARDESDGRIVPVREAINGRPYQCIGCFQSMMAKRGKVRAWHFAHKPPFDRCDPDNALHETAKAVIVKGFNDALESQGEYHFGCPCVECESPLSRNLAVQGTAIELEAAIVEGTRSDLAVTSASGCKVIVEVVVTHDLETETRERYRESGIPVLKIRPTWDTLAELSSAVIASNGINVSLARCRTCKGEAERKSQMAEKARRRADLSLAGLNERKPSKLTELPFRPWTHDKFDRPMFPHIRKQVYANAIILTELGFRQAKGKSWLFLYQIPGEGVVFANFGSTEEVAIWENTSALVHWKLNKSSDEMGEVFFAGEVALESALIEGLLTKLRAAGARVRISFYAGCFDNSEGLFGVNPTERVNRQILSKLLAAADQIFLREQQRVEKPRQSMRKDYERKQGQQEDELEKLQEDNQPGTTGGMDANAMIAYAKTMPRAKWQRFVETEYGIVDLETGEVVG